MARLTIDAHRHTDKAVSWLAAVPVLGVTPHRHADPLLEVRNSSFLEMLSLFLRCPLVRLSGVSAERAENLLITHFVPPVVLVHLERKQAFLRWALPVEVTFRVRRDGNANLMSTFQTAQFPQQLVKHRNTPSFL